MVDSALKDNQSIDNSFKEEASVDNTRTKDAPASVLHILPIRYWLISVAMAALFIGGVSGWQSITQEGIVPLAHKYNIERLTTPTEGLRIVTLGDSYTRLAIPFDERLEKIALERRLSLKYTQFSKDAGKPEHFAVLLPHILAAKPDFVFLLAKPFLMGPMKTKESFLASFRKGIKNIRKIILGQETNEARRKRRLYIHNTGGEVNKADDWKTKPELVKKKLESMKKEFIVFAPKMPEIYEEFFKAAQAQGIRVILLDIGHSKIFKDSFSPEFNDQVTSNLAKLGASYQIDVWSFPSTLPLTHFTDSAHLNIKGQRVFVNWFLGRVMDEVKIND
jgi:hypothetical protein